MAIAARVIERATDRVAGRAEAGERAPLARRGVAGTRSHGTRSHSSVRGAGGSTARAERIAAAPGPRPMVRYTAGIEVDTGPRLALVPRRRRAARLAGVLCAVVVLVMFAAAAFQTQLASRQVQLDQLDQDIQDARESYDQLRRERAELRSPSRLAEIAAELGMVPASNTDFMVMSPEVLAEIQRSIGHVDLDDTIQSSDPLDQFRTVKSVTDGAP